ncbi:triphosphoribosyl-dephospho-CoA synthase MdcB [Acidisoma cellulosilytica]|uniref:Probable 2-(5''-triphosphoribosyl)-3'-dephosphocoenzyme-A synthase n=1 Tax=Acidisoma cellulosilyticum TaxID=2802395 RepID=A0A964E484_9PROT|nr:triphosphoribosyl-dephospho-CoA synthase MdcB [Acidisoma cellulosilyticum]MCB8881430.1 triphosphoribosyl-dephospho-CoA synthase MdcB [Acidisoma cellulosilyticum]
MSLALAHRASKTSPASLGAWASACLRAELETYPKPGLVSHRDCGAHRDMDASLLRLSATTLEPFFADLAAAGAAHAEMDDLRRIGIAAEKAMLRATGGVNTHRGAIFGLGLLCAAAGLRQRLGLNGRLGDIVTQRWGRAIGAATPNAASNGAVAGRRFRVGGARAEAAAGFPSVYAIALPALRSAHRMAPDDAEAARVQTCLALIAQLDDTNLLHRGGAAGLAFAQDAATGFLAAGGIAAPDWLMRVAAIHADFVTRNLSPGGAADLLAMALFLEPLEA